MQTNSNSNTAFILTLLFPFGGLIYSLSHWREKWAKNTFWLACIYMGAVLIYWPAGTILGAGADGGRYVLRLMDMYNNPNMSISSIFANYLRDAGATMDLYQPLVTFLVSRFTDNGHVLFAAFAVVFGFFYSRNIWYVLEKLPNKRIGYLFILITLFFLVSPITNINGVRMWTALHVFVYGMMPYLLERKRTKLWWVAAAPLFHFSFLYVSVFALLFSIIPSRLKTSGGFFLTIAHALLIVSLFVNSLSLDVANDMLAEYSPESFDERIDAYTNQDYQDNINAFLMTNSWHTKLSGTITHWAYNILLLLMLPCLKRNFKNKDAFVQLYIFALLISSFANIAALLPSGGRFQLLSQMFKLPLILLVAMNIPQTDGFRNNVNIALVPLLLPFFFEIRKLFDFIGITAILGNFITVFFWESNVPLIQFIK